MFSHVEKNDYGFYELKSAYRKGMNDFYRDGYYQNENSVYQLKQYSHEELIYKSNLFSEKKYLVEENWESDIPPKCLLDIGCGEGWLLSYFEKLGWDVLGIDLSEFGLNAHNPNLRKHLRQGDFFSEVIKLKEEKRVFDYINLDYVLEHIPTPGALLDEIKNIIHENTIISVSVPNDFSVTQRVAYDEGYITNDFWVTTSTSEHFNYFTEKSLVKYLEAYCFEKIVSIASYPIDFNLFNSRTNYIENKEVGHDGYLAQVAIENMLFAESLNNTINLHKALAEAGVGRNITVFCKIKS